MQRKIITTKDNSKTLLIPSLNETYHSTHGAITESKHIYIANGIAEIDSKDTIHIFEMGFGTGLNCILTLDHSKNHSKKITYTTIEKFPLTPKEIESLDYLKELDLENLKDFYNTTHSCSYSKTHELNDLFKFSKYKLDLKSYKTKHNQFDIIYFDAFAPQHQPDLWTIEILKEMYRILKPNGFLITYCAQGQFKRNLKSVGFNVIGLDGPPGKREITKAIKK